jgi:threonine/homoserine/homoserine lactone efflux protein
MLILAAMPSTSVLLVVTRAASLGWPNGAAVAAGIAIGDLIFATLALLGMGILAETMGAFFAVVRYLGGAYLIWLGLGLLRSKNDRLLQAFDLRHSTLLASFGSGLLLTLGDVKAILFYASLFPTFVDVNRLTIFDITTVIAVTIMTVGGVKLVYAFMAQQIILRLKAHQANRNAKILAGGLMIGTGTYLIAKT